jgi:site-specific DNA-methyltransferase (adenine-specific)
MSSIKQDWTTPKLLYDDLNKEFHFDFDPCPINPQFDGLKISWGNCNFVNPPYNKIKLWIEKGFNEFQSGKTVVFLIPARTDTKWFHTYIYHKCTEIRFIKGRLKFGEGKGSAPFPSMIIIFKFKEEKA